MLNLWCSCCDGALCDVKTPSIPDLTTIKCNLLRSRLSLPPHVQHCCFHPQHFSKSHSPVTQVLTHTPQLPCDRLKFLLEYKEWDKRSYFRLLPCLLLATFLSVPSSVPVASERKTGGVSPTNYTKLQVENDETYKNEFTCRSCKTAAKCSNVVIGH